MRREETQLPLLLSGVGPSLGSRLVLNSFQFVLTGVFKHGFLGDHCSKGGVFPSLVPLESPNGGGFCGFEEIAIERFSGCR